MIEEPATEQAKDTLKKTFIALKRAQARVAELEARRSAPVAIIGMACRLPGGANDPEALWQLLCDGADTSQPIPAERWPGSQFYNAASETPGHTHAVRAHFLDMPVYEFDAPFFGVSSKEATAMDPQQRLLLELGWEALEDAGIDPSGLRGSRTGVFVGISSDDYAQAHRHSGQLDLIDGYSLTGSCFAPAAGRISYTFGFEGPSLAVDTACSSSLVAVHLACRSLREGEIDLAVTAGVNLILSPVFHIASSKLGTISPDGLCKTFDASADGYGRGEGCGVVLLKRLADAQRDGDRILAVIRGSAVNQDGKSNGLTAPNGLAQERVIREALAHAGLQPEDIDYVEVHGTGTPLGDPIEVEAIGRVMAGRPKSRPVVLGTVKSNIGHLEAAAGIAGLIKTVLCLRHGEIPAHLHLDNPSPHIPWGSYPFKVVTQRSPWSGADAPRRAGISSFGFSGTNAHLIVEQAPAEEASTLAGEGRAMLLPLSARSLEALRALATHWRDWLADADEASLATVCATAAVGRAHMSQRLAVTGKTRADLIEGLENFLNGQPKRNVATGSVEDNAPKIAALFTGQGSQYPGMGRALYESEPVFRDTIDACSDALGDLGGRSLVKIVYGPDASDEELRQTGVSQPAIFAVEVGLFRLWESWGVRPSIVCGHSVGEYAAACAAGILSFADALDMVASRGRLMQQLPPGGAMAAVFAGEAEVAKHLLVGDGVSLAAINTPNDVVVSGPAQAVEALLLRLAAGGISGQKLNVSHAFHSSLMRPAVSAFEAVARRSYGTASRSFVSTVSGRKAVPGELGNARYWAAQIEAPVRFAAAVATIRDEGCIVFLEMGPAPVLSGLARQCLQGRGALLAASLMRGTDDRRQMLDSIAQLYVRGAPIDWRAVVGHGARRATAPTYPFQRKSYYLPPISGGAPAQQPPAAADVHLYLGQRVRSPLLPEGAALFQALFTAEYPPFLREHQIFDKIISPAAAHLSMALAAGGGQRLEDVSFTAPLVVEQGAPRLVQVIVEAGSTPAYSLVSQATAAPGDLWTVHSAGTMLPAGPPPASVDLDAIRARCTSAMEPADFYQLIETLGYKTGDQFQCMVEINQGAGEALCHIKARSPVDPAAIHPGLIDTLLQTVLPACAGAASHMLDGKSLLVPLHAGRFSLYGSLDQLLVCHTTMSVSGEVIKAQIKVYDARGAAILVIDDFLLKRTNRDILYQELGRESGDASGGLVHEITWQPFVAPSAVTGDAASWIVLAEPGGWGAALAEQLRERGSECLEIYRSGALLPGAGRGLHAGQSELDPADRNALSELLLRESAGRGRRPVNLVFAWHGGGSDPGTDCRAVCAALLPLVQAAESDRLPVELRLWLLTRQAQSVVPEDGGMPPPSLDGGMLWGAGRAISREMPHIWGGLVDLESFPSAAAVSLLINVIDGPSGEDQIAIRRSGQLFAARLTAVDIDAHSIDRPSVLSNGRYVLDKGPKQTLDDLRFVQCPRVAPGADEIEIEVLAAGLNFRDVLNALGQYPGEAGKLGFEVAGIVTARGDGVSDLDIGARVIALAVPGCIGSHATFRRSAAIRMPARLTPAEAVTLPAAFLTAHYALHHLGKLNRGERVLIHAAAGGVGLAAVQLALAAGAEVFATVGSPEKQAHLRAMGVKHIMSSRTGAFAEEIRALTGGQGVDVVLNALSGDFIAASFLVLAPGGRFLEMGKIGIWDEARVRALDPSWVYRPFDLATVALEDPVLIAAMFAHVLSEIDTGRLTPLPVTLFPMQEAREAFRFMAQARHIGKIVLSRDVEHRQQKFAAQGLVRRDASYLVTGGLGALGLRVAHWLAEAGAGQIILAGRRSPDAAARTSIAELEARGATVTIVEADVSTSQGVASMIAAAHHPLAGIIHAAGLLEDGMMADLDLKTLERIMAPKVAGTWRLHEAVRHLDLDFFVLFSSVAAIIGNLGQGGYALSNAFMDGLAAHRRRQGLAAISINWGPWAESGMAARLDTDFFTAQGIKALDPDRGLKTLDDLLHRMPVQAVVADADWDTFRQFNGLSAETGLFAKLARATPQAKHSAAPEAPARDILAELQATLPGQREDFMRRYLLGLARQTLGYGEDDPLSSNQPLADQGFDSLMSVDMRNRLNRAFGRVFPASLLFDFPTLDKIGKHLLATVMPADVPTPATRPEVSAEALLEEIEELVGR
jgi:acyl transferase domain-containing protein/NADPH:quinone reductase-like Zn-dependent oxidoreductase